jgi:hypothetical protein
MEPLVLITDNKMANSTDSKIVEAKWAVTIDGVGKLIIDATGAGQAKSMAGRSLKKGMKDIVGVQRVQSAFGKQIDKKIESVVEGRLSSYQKKAILIAIQMSGNMTNAVKKIEKIKKGLSKDKKVKDALRLANESVRVLAIKEGVKTSKAFNNFQKSRSSFLERWGKLKKQLNTIKTESPNNEYLRLEKQLYKFETAFIEQSAKIMSSVSKISKSNLTESVNKGKLSEDYKNSEWEVYVADENGKEKIVKKAKSKRAGVILYNKLINSDKYHEVGMRVVKESVNEGDGLWANIRAKKARGEKPAHKNSKAHKDAVKAGDKIEKEESVVNEASLDPKQLLRQLGGNKFIAMTGAKNLAVDKSKNELHMKIGRNSKSISHVIIKLTSADLYNMEFLSIRGSSRKIKSKEKGVYADQLGKMFTKNTGLNVRL